jgi:hypothetical protein
METLDPFRNQELAAIADACGIRHFSFPAKIIGRKLMADNKAFVVFNRIFRLDCRVVLSCPKAPVAGTGNRDPP